MLNTNQQTKKPSFLKLAVMFGSVVFTGLVTTFVSPYKIFSGNVNNVVHQETVNIKTNCLENEQLKISTDNRGNILSIENKQYKNTFNGSIQFTLEKVVSDNGKISSNLNDRCQILLNKDSSFDVHNTSKQNPSYFISKITIKKSDFQEISLNTGKQVIRGIKLNDSKYMNSDGFIAIKDNNKMVTILSPGEEGYCTYNENQEKDSYIIMYKSALTKDHSIKAFSGPYTYKFLSSLTGKNYTQAMDLGFFSFISVGMFKLLDYCMYLGNSINGQGNYFGLGIYTLILLAAGIIYLYFDVKVDMSFEVMQKDNNNYDKNAALKVLLYKALCFMVLIFVFFNVFLNKISINNFYFDKMALFGFADISLPDPGFFVNKFYNFGILQILTIALYTISSYDEEKNFWWVLGLTFAAIMTKSLSVYALLITITFYLIKKLLESILKNDKENPYNFVETPVEN